MAIILWMCARAGTSCWCHAGGGDDDTVCFFFVANGDYHIIGWSGVAHRGRHFCSGLRRAQGAGAAQVQPATGADDFQVTISILPVTVVREMAVHVTTRKVTTKQFIHMI